MNGEVWLEVGDLAAIISITPRAIQKRLASFITRAVKGKGGASGTRCVFHAMTADDFRSRRRNVSGQGGG